MRAYQLLFPLAVLLTNIFSGFGQDSLQRIRKRIYVTRALGQAESPVIDGDPGEACWDLVPWEGDFIEQRPDENTAPDHQTRFKILYDTRFLYVGIRCLDSEPGKIVKRLSRRDGFEGDWVAIFIDSYHDLRNAFGFLVTAAGVKADLFESNNGGNEDESWNPIWYTKARTDSLGWSAEMKIPLSQLKFGAAADQVWGLQIMRRLFREEERSVWQRLPPDAPGFVSEFGELHGLLNLEPQKQLEIQPYTVARLKTYEKEAGNPFEDGSDPHLTAGLDARIGVTNDLTLDLTINPDFGQVEADPSAIALDGFQIFFQERRPFFVENKNIFDFSLSVSEAGNTFDTDNLFYSRRIGRSPQGTASTGEGEFEELPDNTPILGAAKFSGKTRDGWSVGVLEGLTSRRFATISGEDGRRREIIEPLTHYFLGRVQKDFNQRNSYIGGMVTATHREGLTEQTDFLHQGAWSGGIDFKHQWKGRDWYVEGNFFWSHVSGDTEAIRATQESIVHLFQRPRAGHVEVDSTRTTLSGTGGNLQLGKIGNGHWKFETGGTWRSPQLELNDLGFQTRADDIRHYTWIGYQTLKPDRRFRRLGINYNHWAAWDFGGYLNLLQFNTNSWQNWEDNWFSNIGFTYMPIQYSNFALRGGPRLRLPPEISFWNGIETDGRKKLSFNLFHRGRMGSDRSYSNYNVEFGINYQPVNALRLSAVPALNVNRDQLQFIENLEFNGAPRYVNGEISQRTLSMSLRMNYTINPNLSVQYWGQPFISRGRYSAFKQVTDPLAKTFENRVERYEAAQLNLMESEDRYYVDEDLDGQPDYNFENPDFSVIQFRSNLVIRWEYIPGSELFLVWSQDLSQSGDPREGLLPSLSGNLFGTMKPTNIFLLKATYRFIF